MLQDLTVPKAHERISTALRSQASITGIQGMVLWERNTTGSVDFISPNHHTLSIYLSGGDRTWSRDSKKWGSKNAVSIMPQDYDTHWHNEGYVQCLHLYFDDIDLSAIYDGGLPPLAPSIYGHNRLISSLSSSLVNHLRWTDGVDTLTVEHLVVAMLSQVHRVEEFRTYGLSSATLERIDERLSDFGGGVPSLAELAADAQMSARNLTRVYKATTGLTISERRIQLQIERAKQELMKPLSLASVALNCGFSSQSHFTRVFRAHTGAPPLNWKKAQM